MQRPDAHAEVQRLCEEIRHHASARNLREVERVTDEIETITRAYLTPTVRMSWEKYGLSKQQARVADLLHAKLGETVSRDAIMNACYFDADPDHEPDPRIIQVRICHTNRRLRENGAQLTIKNVWGQGYRMVSCCDG